MDLNQLQQAPPKESDEDVKFEIEKESAMGSHIEGTNKNAKNPAEGTIPAKEDTLGHSDFPPLSELEKQPKLKDEERIKEMGRRTSIDH